MAGIPCIHRCRFHRTLNVFVALVRFNESRLENLCERVTFFHVAKFYRAAELLLFEVADDLVNELLSRKSVLEPKDVASLDHDRDGDNRRPGDDVHEKATLLENLDH